MTSILTPAPPADGRGDWAAIWYVTKDRLSGVLFAFRLGSTESSSIFPLAGLVSEQAYRVSLFSAESIVDTTGEALAQGLGITILGQFQSELVLVELR